MWTYLVVKCHYVCKLLSRASTTNECGGGQGKERERKTNTAKRR